MEDGIIVQLYLNRDESAIKETESKYGRYLAKIAYNILYDEEDSKEVLNDTYLAAWNSIPPNVPELLSVYLSRITRRISIDIFRKRNTEKRKGGQFSLSFDELSECLTDASRPDDALNEQILSKAISDYLRTLPEKTRTAFIGRYYYVDSIKDIAKYCGVTESNAKVLLYRARCGLREYLIKEGFDI